VLRIDVDGGPLSLMSGLGLQLQRQAAGLYKYYCAFRTLWWLPRDSVISEHSHLVSEVMIDSSRLHRNVVIPSPKDKRDHRHIYFREKKAPSSSSRSRGLSLADLRAP